MFKIGEFSTITHVSIRTLRYYDEIGLFKPIEVDHFTSYRYYSAKQLPILNTIVSLKYLGFNLNEIREVLEEESKEKHIELLKKKQRELDTKIKDDKNRLESLSVYIENYNKERIRMKYEVVIKSIPSMKVVSFRKVIPAYNQEGTLWQEFMPKVYKNNIQLGRRCYAEFYDESNEENGIDVEVANEVIKLQDNVDGLVFKELDEMETAATLLISGPYEPNIAEGFQFIATWIEDNGYKIAGNSRTYYIKGPEEEKDPENWLTEIVIPVKK